MTTKCYRCSPKSFGKLSPTHPLGIRAINVKNLFPNSWGCLLPLLPTVLLNSLLKLPSSVDFQGGLLILEPELHWNEKKNQKKPKTLLFFISLSKKSFHCFQQREGGRGFLILKLSAHLFLWQLEQAKMTRIWKSVCLKAVPEPAVFIWLIIFIIGWLLLEGGKKKIRSLKIFSGDFNSVRYQAFSLHGQHHKFCCVFLECSSLVKSVFVFH